MTKRTFQYLDEAFSERAALVAQGFACSDVACPGYGAGGYFWTNAPSGAS